MTELDQLFRYTALFLLDELLSPVVTPLVLIFGLSHRTQVSNSCMKLYNNLFLLSGDR